ncbi:MAG TPA: alginate export family protein [Bryobacteraceae bacterium]|nr:alginate export family protein [Bryobacteraceae bacterium]
MIERTLALALSAATLASAGDWAELPDWLKLGGELRGRLETMTGLNYAPGDDDTYYLHRLRLDIGIEPVGWLRLFVQGQDARVGAYNHKPVPSNFADSFDLRQGYVEIRPWRAWTVRLGRQELSFGEERLVGASNWSNTGRSFDVARVTYAKPRARVDFFSGAVVATVDSQFDRPHFNNKFHGIYASLDQLPGKSTVQPYVLWKSSATAVDKEGHSGDLGVYTYGVRAVGSLSSRIDYGLEAAAQTGHLSGDSIRAWAGHWTLGRRLARSDRAPRLVAEYNYASGDDSRPGRRGTFDQLYPTNHNKYGTADRIAWRNIHDAMLGLDWKANARMRLQLDYHSFWLADLRDALYTESGTPLIRNPNAPSKRIGAEIDLQASYKVNERLQFGGGCAHLFPGPYLRASTKHSGATAPYVMWTYSF